MDFTVVSEFIAKWGPTVGIVITGVTTGVAMLLAVWVKVKPLFESINSIKDKVVDKAKEDLTNQLQVTSLETQITDLKAKINNPTIGDDLKQQYIKQLATLETIYAKINAGIADVENTTNKYM